MRSLLANAQCDGLALRNQKGRAAPELTQVAPISGRESLEALGLLWAVAGPSGAHTLRRFLVPQEHRVA